MMRSAGIQALRVGSQDTPEDLGALFPDQHDHILKLRRRQHLDTLMTAIPQLCKPCSRPPECNVDRATVLHKWMHIAQPGRAGV